MRLALVSSALLALAALALPGAAGAAARPDGEGAVVVIAGDVFVPRGRTVEGIVVASGDVRLAGRSKGDVVVASGDAVVSGRIDGDLILFGGKGHLLPGAFVSGDVRYGSERPAVAGRARVLGDVKGEDWGNTVGLLPLVGAFSWWLSVTVSTALLALLLLLISPRAADALRARAGGRTGPLIAIGLAIAICLPLASVLAAITVVGIPLAILVLLALLPVFAVGYVAAAWALGRRLVGPPRHRFLAALAGLAVLRALALIPILGLLVGLAAAVYGLGLIGAAIGAAQERPRTAGAGSPGS